MSLAPRLDLRQSQSLVMTPQLQQAIKLLALSNLELEGVIAEELEKNPLLATGGEDGPTAPEPEMPATMMQAEGDIITADRLIEHGDAVADAPLDVDYDAETFHHDSAVDMGSGGLGGQLGMDGLGGAMPEDGADFDSFAAEAPSLQ